MIILIQENRSFDHYFGTLSGVRGFSDPAALPGVFDQGGLAVGKAAYLQPFRLWSDPPERDGQCLNDMSHTWATQHQSWNGGRMDSFVTTHLSVDGAEDGPVVMGYCTRDDLPFFHALADAFTICDGYFCSVLGPTDSNRVMSMSASIDPSGEAGGPVLETYVERVAALRVAALGDDAGTAAGRRGELEGVQRAARRAGAEPAAVLQGVRRPVLGARDRAGGARADARLPRSLHGRRGPRDAAGGVVDHPAAGAVRASRGTARLGGAPGADRFVGAGRPPGRVGADGAVRHARRERRVLRPRPAGDRARRDRRGSG